MKTFFYNLFGKRNNSNSSDFESIHSDDLPKQETINQPVISEDLFTSQELPSNEGEEQASVIRQFLRENHYEQGFSDGYRYHNADDMKYHLRSLGARFRTLIDQLIEQGLSDTTRLKILMSQLDSQFKSQLEALKIKISENEAMISEYRNQKVHSVEDEGWISSAIMEYTRGFQRGFDLFIQESGLLKKYNVL